MPQIQSEDSDKIIQLENQEFRGGAPIQPLTSKLVGGQIKVFFIYYFYRQGQHINLDSVSSIRTKVESHKTSFDEDEKKSHIG